MAGDSINDAPGIAMGTGTDAAMESVGVTLGRRRSARHRPRPPAQSAHHEQHPPEPLFRVRTTPRTCLSPPARCVPPSALPLSHAVAAATMSLTSVSVIANALRLRVATI
jgi:Cu+-exporting ATPase